MVLAVSSGPARAVAPPPPPPFAAAPLDLPAGFVLDGRLRIRRRLGTGGVGTVFEAEDLGARERVAVKVIHPAYAVVEEVVARFRREAEALRVVRGPHVVAVRDAGTALTPSGELPWLAMELVDGDTVADRVARGPLPIAEAIAIAAEALSALAEVHACGVHHRDVKPENLFLARPHDGTPFRLKLIDFGLSRTLRDAPPDRLTRGGFTVGTPMYMAPEQALGDPGADHRIDLFSMGVTLFEMLTGELPFNGPSYTVVLARVLGADPPRPRALRPDLPVALEQAILCALEKDPARRFPDARTFRRAILDGRRF